ncbi:MAG: ATP-binding protein [Pseudomonadota bacterium]
MKRVDHSMENAPNSARAPQRRSLWALSFTALCLALIAAAAAFGPVERFFLGKVAEQNQSVLRLAAAGLSGALRRYEPLPTLVANRPEIRLLLSDPNDPLLVERINLDLKETAEKVEASDIYVIDADGLTLASSNFDSDTSFLGKNFAFRPYFQDAMGGADGRFFALGTTSLKRGYFFSAPVTLGDRVLGVVTVKITVDAFETSWSGGDSEILVVDQSGVVAMSSRADWRLKSLWALTPAALAEIQETRQYPIDRMRSLGFSAESFGVDGARLVQIDAGDDAASSSFDDTYVSKALSLPDPGWSIMVLSPADAARQQTLATFAVTFLGLLLAALILAYLHLRRARLFERIEAQRQAQAELERRVTERTADLNDANAQLLQEVEERITTEAQLRKTQADLVQAGKLAALGQMSASLSHEFNQPLAAVKSYADNASAYLDRGRAKEAHENVARISEMADRMAAISQHLRNFARKPQEQSGPVPVAAAINDAVQILSGKLKGRSARVTVDVSGRDLWVQGGQIRLQQVLVNLISNGLDAMADSTAPQIRVSAIEIGDRVEIHVRDYGPGLSEDVVAHVFDPFFTTKEIGQGLGLGLSISYNIIQDFGGHLSARNHPDGGADFVIELLAAERPSELSSDVSAQTAAE